MIIPCLIIYIIITFAGFIWIGKRRSREGRINLPHFEIRVFLLLLLIYVLPLPLAIERGITGGDLSSQLAEFEEELPSSIMYVCIFLMTLFWTYVYIQTNNHRISPSPKARMNNMKFIILWIILLAISIGMLMLLGEESGGIVSLIFSGYGVTEKFIGRGHYVVAFDWILVLGLLMLFQGRLRKSRIQISIGITLILILSSALFVMGRRGSLVVIALSMAYYAREINWIRKFTVFLIPALMGFLLLNWIGMVRGAAYTSTSEMVDVLGDRTQALSASSELQQGFLSSVTNGTFVAPFETLPQIMKRYGNIGSNWLGATFIKNGLLLVPNVIMPDRPLPMGNWYMSQFYGGAARNEGRQFFLLSEAFLNFNWFGGLIWGVMIAWIFRILSKKPSSLPTSPEWLSVRVLFFGNLMAFIATDTSGFFVAFFKSFCIIPLIFFVGNLILSSSE